MFKKAPWGFSKEQWNTFMNEGILILENVLSEEEINYYIDAIDRVSMADKAFDEKKFYGPENVVTSDVAFSDLIDHPRHVGFVYDIYGELLKLHLSQFFIRPTNSSTNNWHADGARVVPYQVYSGLMPMQVKISYWLTDVDQEEMGNFVYIPGSHILERIPEYGTSKKADNERVLLIKAGSITIAHCNTWHRVEPNNSTKTRKNIFLAYCPSWVCEADRFQSDPEWLKSITREQRIIMRSYFTGYERTRPPAEDFPLFLDREDSAPQMDLHMDLRDRKRKLKIEEFLDEKKDEIG
ncbi:MAG: phytanoyl-CoA dioxygenase family protein [Fluviicola sp.]|nr:phytanoyl-CoA dioxygenase family protein [Fluviicola sp.]